MKKWFSPSFLLAACLLLGGEFVAREFFGRSLSGRFDYGFNPTAGFQENADGTVDLVKSAGRPFRPQRFSREPAPEAFRVMVFGDSVPYGYYGNGESPLADTYSLIVADELKHEETPAEGINLCITGYGAKRVQIVLRQALKYHPSLVVLHVHAFGASDDQDARRRAEFQGWNPRNWPMKLLLIRRLYEAKTERVFRSWLPKDICDQDADKAQIAQMMGSRGYSQADRDRWLAEAVQFTRESVAMAREQGVPVVLVSQASKSLDAAGRPILDDEKLDNALQTLTGPGVYLISMKQLLGAQTGWESLFTDHVHLNRAGHKAISDAIVQLTREQKLPARGNKHAGFSSAQ